MTKDATSPPGYFQTAFVIVKMLAIYAGVFFLCFYWPQFLSSLTVGHGDPRSYLVAGVLITPLGFLILGAALGKWHAAMHVVLIALGAASSWVGVTQLGSGAEEPVERLIAIWTPAILLIYAAGWILAARRELKS